MPCHTPISPEAIAAAARAAHQPSDEPCFDQEHAPFVLTREPPDEAWHKLKIARAVTIVESFQANPTCQCAACQTMRQLLSVLTEKEK